MDNLNERFFVENPEFLNDLPIGIQIYDPIKMKSLYINNTFAKIHETPKDDIANFSKFVDIMFPDTEKRKKFQQEFQETVQKSTLKNPFWVQKEIITPQKKKKDSNDNQYPAFHPKFDSMLCSRYNLASRIKRKNP